MRQNIIQSKKVVIMSVGIGGGHKAMARSMLRIFEMMWHNVEVKTIDVIADGWPSFDTATKKTYAGTTSSGSSWLFRLYYVLSDRFPRPIQWFANIAFRDYARRTYLEEQPDIIVATFQFLAEAAARARDFHHGTAKIVQTITDAGRVQGVWLCDRADLILTATKDTVPYLIGRGADPSRVRYVGFPAEMSFYNPDSPLVARKKTGLDVNTPTILLTAGGMGLNQKKVIEVAAAISRLRIPYQIILNAGSNEQLKNAFESMEFTHATHVIIEGFTDKMLDYMTASDIICTKSGWLTVNEAIVLQKLLVLYDAIPGHEEQNVKHVVSNKFGIYAPDPRDCARQIEFLLLHPQEREKYHDAMRDAHTNYNPYPDIIKVLGDLFDH